MKENHWGNPLKYISRHSEIVNSPLEKYCISKGKFPLLTKQMVFFMAEYYECFTFYLFLIIELLCFV